MTVVVLGAGFAGLSAAARLAARGRHVVVLEARGRLGGRATAFRDRETGERVDNGQHVLFGCYDETFAFLRLVGAEHNVRRQPDLEVPAIDWRGRRSVLRCPAVPAPMHLLAGVLEWDGVPFRDRLSVLRLARPLRLARRLLDGQSSLGSSAPGETVREWLEMNGQTEPMRRLLWEPLALAALNQPADVAAAEPFVRVLAEMFGGDRTDSVVGLPVRPLDEMYAEPARAFIEARGGEVRTAVRGRIVRTAANAPRVAVSADDSEMACSAVICAVPWHWIDSTLDAAVAAVPPLDAVVTRAAGMRSSPIVTVNLWFDRPVLDVPFVGLPGRTLQWVFDKRLAFGDGTNHLSLVSSGAEAIVEWTNARLIARAATDVMDALPAARTARVTRATVIREPRATFSLAPDAPARPDTRTPFENLFLAGDWIRTGLPSTIESAVVSGHRAADAVDEYLATVSPEIPP